MDDETRVTEKRQIMKGAADAQSLLLVPDIKKGIQNVRKVLRSSGANKSKKRKAAVKSKALEQI